MRLFFFWMPIHYRHGGHTLKRMIPATALFLGLAFCATGGDHAFYLWQRTWTPPVAEAARGCPSPLSVFAAELSARKTERTDAPASLWEKDGITAVFRLRTDALNAAGFDRLAAEIARNGCRGIQLDTDVPERRLGEFVRLLAGLRRKLPAQVTELSFTALPCHLPHSEFAEAAKMADYYVLQLHGIDAPANIDEPYSLLEPGVAREAIRRARGTGRPFRIALPVYAYRLSFDPDSGAFAAISAEGDAPPAGRYRERLAAPDLSLLRELLRENPDLPVIWFRLPVKGDRLCFDLDTVRRLEAGELPSPSLDFELRRIAPRALELWITPHAALRLEPFRLELRWPQRTGEFETASGVRNESADRAFAILPTRLAVPFGGCGVPVRAATFFVDETNRPAIKEILP